MVELVVLNEWTTYFRTFAFEFCIYPGRKCENGAKSIKVSTPR